MTHESSKLGDRIGWERVVKKMQLRIDPSLGEADFVEPGDGSDGLLSSNGLVATRRTNESQLVVSLPSSSHRMEGSKDSQRCMKSPPYTS